MPRAGRRGCGGGVTLARVSGTIRPATVEDGPELARLRWEFRIEQGTPPTLDRAAFDAEMAAFVADALAAHAWRIWVAEDAGCLIGCVWLHLVQKVPHPDRRRDERPVGYVTNMYVEPGLRDAGLGRALLDEALAHARERDVDGVVVWPSERSVPFYRRAGFGQEGAPLWLGVAGD